MRRRISPINTLTRTTWRSSDDLPPESCPGILWPRIDPPRAGSRSRSSTASPAWMKGPTSGLNRESPYNYRNGIVPQPAWGNVATAGAYLGEGVLSTSLGFTSAPRTASPLRHTISRSVSSRSIFLSGTHSTLWRGRRSSSGEPGTRSTRRASWSPRGHPSDPFGQAQPERRPEPCLAHRLRREDVIDRRLPERRHVREFLLHMGKERACAPRLRVSCGARHVADRVMRGKGRGLSSAQTPPTSSGRISSCTEKYSANGDPPALYHRIITSDDPAQIFASSPYLPLYADSRRDLSQNPDRRSVHAGKRHQCRA